MLCVLMDTIAKTFLGSRAGLLQGWIWALYSLFRSALILPDPLFFFVTTAAVYMVLQIHPMKNYTLFYRVATALFLDVAALVRSNRYLYYIHHLYCQRLRYFVRRHSHPRSYLSCT
jgi:hypothetical protein